MQFIGLRRTSTICLWGWMQIPKAICSGFTSKWGGFVRGKGIGSMYTIFKRRRLCTQEAWNRIFFQWSSMSTTRWGGIREGRTLVTLKILCFLSRVNRFVMINRVNFSNFPFSSRHSTKAIVFKSHTVLHTPTPDLHNSSHLWHPDTAKRA